MSALSCDVCVLLTCRPARQAAALHLLAASKTAGDVFDTHPASIYA